MTVQINFRIFYCSKLKIMKNAIFLLLLFSLNCFSQTVEVKYFENEIISNHEQLKTLPKNIQINYKPNFFSYKLITNGVFSQYQNEKINLKVEEEMSEPSDVTESGGTLKTFVKSSGIDMRVKEKLFFKNFQKNKIYEEQFFDKKVKISDDIIEWNWKILDETEIILGYKCIKATSDKFGSTIYVWFTDEIPISDGPLKYSGLPGLILKVKLKHYDITAYNINFKKEKIEILPPVLNGKIFTYNEFIEEMNRRNKKL